MSRLTERGQAAWRAARSGLARRGGEGDAGAVAAMVAVLLAGGVLLGFAAVVVDVGQIYVERSELQTGADAAAVAVAKACSIRDADCGSRNRVTTLARRYGNVNAADGLARLVLVCGRLPRILPACTASTGNLTDCLGSPPLAPVTYVEVRLATRLPGNRFALPPTFARAMAGNSGFDGASVGACARARWEPASDTPVLAMTISTCEHADATAAGARGPYLVHFRAGAYDDRCGEDPAGPWRPGAAAGWLRGTGQCLVQLPATGVIAGQPLVPPDFPPPAGCAARLDALLGGGPDAVALVPIHDLRWGAGRRYRHVSVVPVRIDGYYFGSAGAQPPEDPPCGDTGDDDEAAAQRCVSVTFVGSPLPLSSLAGGPIVRLIG